MTVEYYSTPADVIQSTGIRPDDLGMETTQQLNTWITARLQEIKNLIDQDRNRDYAAEAETEGKEVPKGINGIALRMMSNHIGHANLRRTTPIIRVDDFTIKMIEDQVFTTAIKNDLKRYPKKPRFRFLVVTGTGE